MGSFPPNVWGLHDMHGNVWEMVEDCPHSSYAGAPPDGSAWTTDCGTGLVVRGGSMIEHGPALRSASRAVGLIEKYGPFNNIGFRVARTIKPSG